MSNACLDVFLAERARAEMRRLEASYDGKIPQSELDQIHNANPYVLSAYLPIFRIGVQVANESYRKGRIDPFTRRERIVENVRMYREAQARLRELRAWAATQMERAA